jgi:hypothetical protein
MACASEKQCDFLKDFFQTRLTSRVSHLTAFGVLTLSAHQRVISTMASINPHNAASYGLDTYQNGGSYHRGQRYSLTKKIEVFEK